MVRINTREGTEVFPLPVDAWICHPDGTDVAVAALDLLPAELEARGAGWVPHTMYILPLVALHVSFGLVSDFIGPGDECFFIGRFSTHEGRHQNRPSVRFGNLAMTHGETIKDEDGLEQTSFLVEARSLAGFSGSPVFIYQGAGINPETGMMSPTVRSHVWLLGVDWCHLSHFEPVLGEDKETPVEPKQWVRRNTGMAGVIPAWKIVELLNEPEVVTMRKNADKERLERERGSA